MNNRDKWCEAIWKKIEKKLELTAKRNNQKLPYTVVDGQYDDQSQKDPNWWTNGFWPGMMWMMYAKTGEGLYKESAQEGERLLDTALKRYDELHHDVGFMWHISSGASFRLSQNEDSKTRAMYAANVLAGRFNLRGQFIRAWNGEDQLGWSIIDAMMNLPLLYWASLESKDPRFSYIAQAHADMTMANHLREDGSVKHIVVHDPINGGAIGEERGQGYSEGSSWSRGQAWALYGFALSYRYTGNTDYLAAAKRVAHYFMACVSEDWLPKCDFRSPSEPVIYDSTAGAIAACGLLEIGDLVEEFEKNTYYNGAYRLLMAMEQNFCNWDDQQDSILQMGTERYHSNIGRHIPIIYGDFFFVEAITRLLGGKSLW
ncbi:glycoside hydrolase family 88 protein [Cellulosilyticum sp. I15G10I2]|uniref:glycoside hydrolase family 88 protein n=1 Tax=Cellulosilyticum sp. I15G10I2 TaxID=1892843 RepID=UPI0009F631B2|nr:glycoside hydrolase family 88 protein [Cellulosilyticum sp. I15G10I2]